MSVAAEAGSPDRPVIETELQGYELLNDPLLNKGTAFSEQERFERGDLVKVGVTDFVDAGEQPIEILEISGGVETDQVERVREVRERRDAAEARAALDRLGELAATDANLVEPLVDCARAMCTEGEIVEALRAVFGSYTETPRF